MPRPGLCRQFQSRLRQGPQNAGLLARQRFNMRHSPEGSGSELFEEGQQLVVRAKTLGSAFDWIGFG